MAALVVGTTAAYIILDEPLPEGEIGQAADDLALEMLTAIQHQAWENTQAVEWNFPGGHYFLWDRTRHYVMAEWDENKVLLHLKDRKGIAWTNGQQIDPANRDALLEEAWKLWANDSFWLNAPAKVFDPGTVRKLVKLKNDERGLLITYTSGGVTPGDSYLWIMGKDGLPRKWKMWVQIIPIGGMAFTWEKWEKTATGAMIATYHDNPIFGIEITGLKTANTLSEITEGKDPFSALDAMLAE